MKLLHLLFAIAVLVPAVGDCGNFDGLVANSPFYVVNLSVSAPQNAAASDSKYELRGMFFVGNDQFFNIYSVEGEKFKWVKLGDASSGFYVHEFDEIAHTLVFSVTGDSKKHTVRLKNAPVPIESCGVFLQNAAFDSENYGGGGR